MPTSGPHATTEDDGNWGEDIWIEMLEEKTTTETTTTTTTTKKEVPTTLETTTLKSMTTVGNKIEPDCDIRQALDRVLN